MQITFFRKFASPKFPPAMPAHLSTPSSTLPSPALARHYHSALSIWLSVDPMSDKYPGTSPYTYCANNPVRLVDPDGREMDEWSFNVVTGECKWISDKGGNAVSIYHFIDPLGTVLHSEEHLGYAEPEYIYNNVSDASVFYSSFNFIGECSGFGGFYYKVQYDNNKPIEASPNCTGGGASFIDKLEYTLRGHADNSRWEGHGDYWERRFGERAKPYVTSAVLLFPHVSFINSVKTVTTGSDIYENKADGVDYTLGIVGTFLGVSNFFRNVPKFVKRLDGINTLFSFGYYEYKSNKDENKNGN